MKNFLYILSILIWFLACKTNEENKSAEYHFACLNSDSIIEEEQLNVKYIGMMCPCPQWMSLENYYLYNESLNGNNSVPYDSLAIEIWPKNDSLKNPIELIEDFENEFLVLSGYFCQQKRKWVAEDGSKWENRVFIYKSFSIVSE